MKELFGPHWLTKWFVIVTVSIQMFMAWAVKDLGRTSPDEPIEYAFYIFPKSIWLWVCTYTISGVINHSLTLAMHEISHNLAFRSLTMNRMLGIVANMPLGIPSFAQFKRYHREHHKYQGEEGVDTDIPTDFEGHLIKNTIGKLIWVVCQPLAYALRPNFVIQKKPGKMEAINWAAVIAFDALVYSYAGWNGVFYLVFGTLLGMGLHPMAGHFIAEHYTFIKSQETYSYYGPLNWFSYNVGYHNEHHDFPFISGWNLPKLRELAPEFYDNMPHHSSWTKVIFEYIFDPTVGPYSRVKRGAMDEDTRKRIMSGLDA